MSKHVLHAKPSICYDKKDNLLIEARGYLCDKPIQQSVMLK